MFRLSERVLVERGQRDGQIIRFGDHAATIFPAQAPCNHAWRTAKPEAVLGTTRILAACGGAPPIGEI